MHLFRPPDWFPRPIRRLAPTLSGAATTIRLTGPTAGDAGVASTNFTVDADGIITGTITVSLSDGGDGGTFTPSSVAISAGTPSATFTYTPGSAGSKTLTLTNNGGLANPGGWGYTAAATTVGTILTDVFKNWGIGTAMIGETIDHVVCIRVSDGVQVLNLTSQGTNSAGRLPIVNSALVTGTAYMVGAWNDDGTLQRGFQPYTAS